MIGSLSSDSTASAADTDHDDEADEAAVKHELKEVSHPPDPGLLPPRVPSGLKAQTRVCDWWNACRPLVGSPMTPTVHCTRGRA